MSEPNETFASSGSGGSGAGKSALKRQKRLRGVGLPVPVPVAGARFTLPPLVLPPRSWPFTNEQLKLGFGNENRLPALVIRKSFAKIASERT